jgi:hypothetical protein
MKGVALEVPLSRIAIPPLSRHVSFIVSRTHDDFATGIGLALCLRLIQLPGTSEGHKGEGPRPRWRTLERNAMAIAGNTGDASHGRMLMHAVCTAGLTT